MLRCFRVFVLICGLMPTGVALALEGVFWDPDFAGEGWAIESQNDVAFWTWYTYAEDGEPTFRSAVAQVTITVDPLGNIIIDMAGDLFRTRDRDDTTVEGPFTARFQSIAGTLVGDVNANGQRRSLVPFEFNFVNAIDKLQGYWAITTLDPDLATGASVFALSFSPDQTTLDDGTAAKTLQTFDGRDGLVIFDEGLALFVAGIDNGDDTMMVFSFEGSDQRSFGTTATTDAAGLPISAIDLIYANALANTPQEAAAVDELFPFFPFPAKGKAPEGADDGFVSALRNAARIMR